MDIITRLRAVTSTLQKQDILEKYATEVDKKVFQRTYNLTAYGLHFDYIDYKNLGQANDELFHILNGLASKALTGNTARNRVIDFAEEYGDLIKLICNKDLDCGISSTTLNNVFGKNFIPTFNIQLAKEEDINKIEFPILAQLKYNGARVCAFIENGEVLLKSRGGHSFSFPALENVLMELPFNIMLDGELTIGDSCNEDHTAVSGMVNSAIKGTPINDLRLVYNIFDFMPVQEFYNQKCLNVYHDRLKNVMRVIDILDNKSILRYPNIKVINAITTEVANKEDLVQIYETLVARGYEGLILKKKDSKYTFKKNKTWIKMKAVETADLTCVGYEEGKDKYEGLIGSLTCEGVINGVKIKVNVAGLTDVERNVDPQYYIGKTIEVKYNKIIANKDNGTMSLFLPRFVCVRRDK